ncbi:MAG: type II secretion system protein [Alphaproteobacteria bacterium]
MSPYKLLKNDEGFLLIEVAIALLIMGIILGFGMPKIFSYLTLQKRKETTERQERIFHSVAAFSIQYGYIPLPADPYALPDQFGWARSRASSEKDLVGLVPYKTLGLPADYSKDGFNHYFTYAGGWPNPGFVTRKIQTICQMRLPFPLNISSYAGPDPILLTLISYGEKGRGAYKGSPGHLYRNREGLTAGEKQNAAEDLGFIDQAPTPNFDHHVAWVTGRNLMAIYGKVPMEELNKPDTDSAAIFTSGNRQTTEGIA